MLRIGSAAWRSSQGFASARLIKGLNRAETLRSPAFMLQGGNASIRRPAIILPFHSAQNFRSISTGSETPETPTSSLTDISSSIDPAALNTLLHDATKIGDLHALGLGSYYTPVGWVQNILEALHVTGGFTWWGSIVVLTLTARILLFPAIISQLKNTARLNNIKPEMEHLTALMNGAQKAGNKAATQKYTMELKNLYKRSNCSPFRGLMMPLIQAPIFISFFLGIRKMAELPVGSLKTGGVGWVTDLTAMDPYYILPVLSAASFLVTIELGTDGVSPQQQGQMKKIFRGMAVLMIPLTYHLPSGVFVYWMTTNLFSLFQFALLKAPGVKSFFNIPALIKHKENPNIKRMGFMESLKNNYNSQIEKNKETNQLRKIEEDRAAEIAAGPPLIHTNKQKGKKRAP